MFGGGEVADGAGELVEAVGVVVVVGVGCAVGGEEGVVVFALGVTSGEVAGGVDVREIGKGDASV